MKVFHVLIDSSVLYDTHFNHPDFRLLLQRSQERKIKIYIPHIVLEEHRTQMTAEIDQKVKEANRAFRLASRSERKHLFFTQGLREPHFELWTPEEIDKHSRQVVKDFVLENKIEELPIGADHASRAWSRYFDVAPPFNADTERTARRKDIPDSWIFEAALDLKARGLNDLCALCGDRRLKYALKEAGFEIFEKVELLAAMVDAALAVYPIGGASPAPATLLRESLKSADFADVKVAVLGFIGYFDAPPKEKLFELLEQAGFDRRVVENVAQGLVLASMLRDSGNHYLPVDKSVAQQAADEVQPLVLKLLENGS